MTDPKCDGTNGHAQRHFNQACSFDDAIFAHIKGFGRQKCGPGDHDRRQSDKRVESGNKLGHIRHGNAAGNRCTNDAANGNARDDGKPDITALTVEQCQRRRNGDDHARHAKIIATPRCIGRTEPAQRDDEQHARGQIKEGEMFCDSMSSLT